MRKILIYLLAVTCPLRDGPAGSAHVAGLDLQEPPRLHTGDDMPPRRLLMRACTPAACRLPRPPSIIHPSPGRHWIPIAEADIDGMFADPRLGSTAAGTACSMPGASAGTHEADCGLHCDPHGAFPNNPFPHFLCESQGALAHGLAPTGLRALLIADAPRRPAPQALHTPR